MKTKLALLVAKWLISYVKKNPEFLYKIADLIPGKVDDNLVRVAVSLISA